MRALIRIAGATSLLVAAVANAQTAGDDGLVALRNQISQERATLEAQQHAIDAQRARLQALESSLLGRMRGTGAGSDQVAATTPGEVPLPPSPPPAAGAAPAGVQTVGQAPTDQRHVDVAVLAEQGGIITKRGRLTVEGDLEYAHADRNEVLFRGVAIPEAVLIGAFDINESRQDVLTAAVVGRLGVTNRFEINARIPYVRRSDNSSLAPVVNNGGMSSVGTDEAVTDGALGDIDFGVRYQFTSGRNGIPYLIGGVQAVATTGTDPFAVPRDDLGNPLKAATGAGFWGVTPTLTAILPSDPAVLFATFGYTFNFGRAINRQIGSAIVNHVTPGGEPAASLGIAVALNPRASISLGYAHTVALGTNTVLQTIDPQSGAVSAPMNVRTRDLQLGRFLFGVSYRTSPSTTINWNIELGATADATDIRTTLRIPFSFGAF